MNIGRIRSKERDDDMAEQEKDILEEELGEEKSVEEQAPEETGESQGEPADTAEAEQDGGGGLRGRGPQDLGRKAGS